MANKKAMMQSTVYKKQSKYQWPADRLTSSEMEILTNWRERTGTPINYLLQNAVVEMDRIIQNGR